MVMLCIELIVEQSTIWLHMSSLPADMTAPELLSDAARRDKAAAASACHVFASQKMHVPHYWDASPLLPEDHAAAVYIEPSKHLYGEYCTMRAATVRCNSACKVRV
jgi:hypothetical protein